MRRWLIMVATLVMAHTSQAATVLITGANAGVGLEFARQYAAAGWTVIATHRHDDTPDSLAALARQYHNVRAERMDVTSVAEMNALAAKLKDVPIDVLINNAAVYNDRGDWSTQQFGKLDYALGDTILKTDVLGPLFVSQAFVAQIAASGQKKIVSITSTHGSLTQPLAGPGAFFYRAAKAGLNRTMLALADELKAQGISVVLIHPGSVRKSDQEPKTSVYGPRIDVDVTVASMRKTIDAVTIKDTGRLMLYDGTTLPW